MRLSEDGDCVLISPPSWRVLSLIDGVLISMAVSQRSNTSSTMRASGRRTAKERARWWPGPEDDNSRPLDGGTPGEARPEEGLEAGLDPDWEGGPMTWPLYSGKSVGEAEPPSEVDERTRFA